MMMMMMMMTMTMMMIKTMHNGYDDDDDDDDDAGNIQSVYLDKNGRNTSIKDVKLENLGHLKAYMYKACISVWTGRFKKNE